MYKIDKGIPIPESPKSIGATHQRIRSEVGNFLSHLEPGDSFFVPPDDNGKLKDVINRFYNPATRIGIRVTIQKWGDGYRVWRTDSLNGATK